MIIQARNAWEIACNYRDCPGDDARYSVLSMLPAVCDYHVTTCYSVTLSFERQFERAEQIPEIRYRARRTPRDKQIERENKLYIRCQGFV